MIYDCWAENGEVRIHYLEGGGDQTLPPVMFIGGLHGRAEQFRPMIEAMHPRPAMAVSLRGRGQSAVPASGYRFEDHVSDIAAVVDTSGRSKVCLVGHSVGATYALGYALQYPSRVEALVMAGYPARYPELSADWGFRTMRNHPDELPMIAVLGLQHDSAELDLWPSLAELQCPLLVLRGAKPTTRLPQELADEYARWAPSAHIEVFEESGHRLWVPDMDRFVGSIESFLMGVTASGT